MSVSGLFIRRPLNGGKGKGLVVESVLRESQAMQLYAEYAHRIDDGRIKEWSELFADDCVLAVRGEEYVGPEAIYAHMTKRRVDGEPSTGRHLIMNIRADLDGDTAVMRADFMHVRVIDDEAVTEMLGVYRSCLRWQDDCWKFARHDVNFLLLKL